jgi:superfamily II DNA or RNA helicase
MGLGERDFAGMSNYLFPIHAPGSAQPFSWRQYQLDAAAYALASLKASKGCLLILPCGCGKTEIAVKLIQSVPSDRRAVVITPYVNLTGQTASRLRLRGVSCGIEQGSMRSDERVTVASYKSLISRDRYQRFLEGCDLVVVDESHLNYSKRSLQILAAFRENGTKIVGMTASPERMSGDPITEFYGPVAYQYTLQQAIDDGYLVPPTIWVTVASDLDLSKFDDGFGDFNAAQVAKAMAREANVQTVTNLVLQHHEGEPSVVFCQGILQAEKVRECLWRAGVQSAIVHSRMEEEERQMHLHDFESGKVNIILNVGCLVVGWDCDIVRKLFMCKPTRSRSQYQQAIGRGTRALAGILDGLHTSAQRRTAIAESGKPTFEIFDLVDASRHNDLITAIDALRPDLPADVAKRVRRKQEDAGAGLPLTALAAALAAEQELLAEERLQAAQRQAALDFLTADQRAGLNADQTFGNYHRDTFAAAETKPKERGWRWLWGPHKGTLLREMDLGYMQWALRKASLKGPFRAAVEREVLKRAKQKTC